MLNFFSSCDAFSRNYKMYVAVAQKRKENPVLDDSLFFKKILQKQA